MKYMKMAKINFNPSYRHPLGQNQGLIDTPPLNGFYMPIIFTLKMKIVSYGTFIYVKYYENCTKLKLAFNSIQE